MITKQEILEALRSVAIREDKADGVSIQVTFENQAEAILALLESKKETPHDN